MESKPEALESAEGSEETTGSEFGAVRDRLAEIARTVGDDSLSLDEALDLYEEAISLGLQASDLLETGIVLPEAPVAEEGEEPDASHSEGSPAVEGEEPAVDARTMDDEVLQGSSNGQNS